jgi:hypothetical protein
MEALIHDVRDAFRSIRRAPGFAAIAIASSAIGIGACSVLFAILNAALFQPLPVDAPDRLVNLSEIDRRSGDAGNELSYSDFMDLRHARSFEGIAASDPFVPASIGPERRAAAALGSARHRELFCGGQARIRRGARLRSEP